jgi:1,4-dihydroxy-6-naphthoate synthase
MGYHGGMKIRLGHATDVDDAFLSFALAAGKVSTGSFEFEHVREDLATLNDRAVRGELDVTPIGVHAYAYVRERYCLGRCGATFASRRGPLIVSRQDNNAQALENATLAVAGTTSSAFLALQLYKPGLRTMVLPGDKIVPAVKSGVVPLGLLAEASLYACAQWGLHCVADLAQWWTAKNGGDPLPLRCLAFRKDIAPSARKELEQVLTESIRYALDHPSEAAKAARDVAGGDATDGEVMDEINAGRMSLDLGDHGKQVIEKFLFLGHQARIIPNALPLEFV